MALVTSPFSSNTLRMDCGMAYIGATAPENKAGRQAGRERCGKETEFVQLNNSVQT